MIGKITPLVQGGREPQLTLLASHLLGGVLGGFVVGAGFGLIGSLLWTVEFPSIEHIRWSILAGACLYLGVADLWTNGLPVIHVTRQTPGWFPCALGHIGGVFAWGFDLGLSVTTRLHYQAFLIVPLFALLSGNLVHSILAGVLFGLGRSLAVILVVAQNGNGFSKACGWINHAGSAIHAVAAGITIAVGTACFLSIWMA